VLKTGVDRNLLTFHKIIEGCREGDTDAWRSFAAEYTPVLTGVAGAYCSIPVTVETAWRDVLRGLADRDFAALKQVDAQSDREFFVALRQSLLHQLARGAESEPRSGVTESAAALEALSGLLKQFPLLHRSVAFLVLAGYPEATIEKILRISPAIAMKSVERLNAEFYPELRGGAVTEWQAVWLAMIDRMHAGGSADCVALRQLIRVLDGQFGWYEKDPIERHLASCLHCLETWVGLQEVTHWMRYAVALTPERANELISELPLKAKPKNRVSLFRRAFR
jgi:hypothetical protein